MNALDPYREVTPKGTVDFLRCLAEKVRGKKILHVNSTRVGGGVAEILRSLVPLLQDIGVEARWEVITGTEDFFAVTKAFHNALQGEEQDLSPEMLETYREINRRNAQGLALDADYVIIHDPQPAALSSRNPKGDGGSGAATSNFASPAEGMEFFAAICGAVRRGDFFFASVRAAAAHSPVSYLSLHRSSKRQEPGSFPWRAGENPRSPADSPGQTHSSPGIPV